MISCSVLFKSSIGSTTQAFTSETKERAALVLNPMAKSIHLWLSSCVLRSQSLLEASFVNNPSFSRTPALICFYCFLVTAQCGAPAGQAKGGAGDRRTGPPPPLTASPDSPHDVTTAAEEGTKRNVREPAGNYAQS